MSSSGGNTNGHTDQAMEEEGASNGNGALEMLKTDPVAGASANGLVHLNGAFTLMHQEVKKELVGGEVGVAGKNGFIAGDVDAEVAVINGMGDIKISEAMDVDDINNGEAAGVKVVAGGNLPPHQLKTENGTAMKIGIAEAVAGGSGVVNMSLPPAIIPKCANGKKECLLDGAPAFPCKRCHRVFYCSDEHRQQHYDEHQPDCKTTSSLEVMCFEEEYSMWLKYAAPHLYDLCLNFVLVWPSLTTQWLPEVEERENNIMRHHLLLGTMTNQEQNHLLICAVDIPDRIKADGATEHSARYDGTMFVVKRINHEAEVNRARYMPQDSNIVATKSSSPEVFIFDCRKYPDVPEDSKFSPLLRLRGHQKEGFGLSWNAKEKGKLLSGSDDALVCLWDLNKSSTTENDVRYLNASRTFRAHEDVVEDVDWHPEQRHVFASVGDDKRLILWDTRVTVSEEAVFIGQNVHERDINAISFSPFSEYALATGSSDSTVAVWDMRNMNRKLHSFEFHQAEVMQVQWSPHSASTLASTGKDNRVFVWDLSKVLKNDNNAEQIDDDPAPNELAFIHGGHVSNVNDISWNHHEMGMMASVTEDNILQVWKISENLQAVYMGDDASDDESGGSASEALDD